jgi:hypothetical protein
MINPPIDDKLIGGFFVLAPLEKRGVGLISQKKALFNE